MPANHQIFSASASSRWIACPGSIAASADCPSPPPNDFADEGTACHLVAEYCLRFGCDAGDASVIVNGKPYEVDEEMREAVNLYVSHIDQIPGKLIVEKDFLLTGDMGGTIDSGKINGKRIHVFDLKYGRRAVLATMNTQLGIYGLGMLSLFPGAEEISMEIIQPRVTPSISTWIVPVADFKKWAEEKIMGPYRKAKEPDAPRHAGTHCRYCRALASCPEHRALVTQAAQSDFDLTAPAPIKLPPVESLTNEQAARLMEFSDLIAEYCKAVKQLAHDRMMAGQKIPGWKVVQKRSNREWVDLQKTMDALGPVLGKKIFTVPEVLSPAQMEKALKAAGREPGLVEPLTRKPDAGLSIAPESDKRKEVVPNPSSDFQAGDLI